MRIRTFAVILSAAFTAFLLCFGIASVVLLSAMAQNAAKAGRTPLDSHRALGTPVTFRNVTVIPVYDTAARSAGTYVTLDEGLKTKQVQVKESANGGEVNTLYLSNAGKKPLYIMAGEVVLGGQQDRCLAKDTTVPPGAKGVPITVFCVEHGRWNGESKFATSAVTVASADIRASAQNGAFAAESPAATRPAPNGQVPALPNEAAENRSAANQSVAANQSYVAADSVSGAQQMVWDKVAAKNSHFKAAPASGTYREVLNMSGGEAGKSVGPYVTALSAGLKMDPHLVGVVAAVNGKVVTADIFGDPMLFRKLWPKLLRSYAADAAEAAEAGGAKKFVVTTAQAKTFLAQAHPAKPAAENKSAAGTARRLETDETVSYGFAPAPKPGAAAAPAAPALHENVLRK